MGRVSEVHMVAGHFNGANRSELLSLRYEDNDILPYLDADQQVLLGQLVGEVEFPEEWSDGRKKSTYAYPVFREALRWIHFDSEIGKTLRQTCKEGAWFYVRERVTRDDVQYPLAVEKLDGEIEIKMNETVYPLKIDERSVRRTLFPIGFDYELARKLPEVLGKESEYVDMPVEDVGIRFSPEGSAAIWITWLEKQDMCMVGARWPANKDKNCMILLKRSKPVRLMTDEEIAKDKALRDAVHTEREVLPTEPSPEPQSWLQMKLF